MTVIIERLGKGIISILINRPSKRNALDLQTFKAFFKALANFESDEESKIAIIGGVGGNFCAGYDLNDIINRNNGMPDMEMIDQMLMPLQTRLSNKKITIAAIEGYTAGLGYELSLRCNFRIADRDSKMGFMNRRFGIPIMNGGTVILPLLVGQSRALEIIATGKAQLASEAIEYGHINYLCDIGCSLGRALNLARSLAKFESEPMLLDIVEFMDGKSHKDTLEKLRKERQRALDFLRNCGPRRCAIEFLDGKLCRHGNFDLGNSTRPEANVSL